MKNPPLVTAFFLIVLVFLIGTGIVTTRDPAADDAAAPHEERYPQEAHVAMYKEHMARLEVGSADCR